MAPLYNIINTPAKGTHMVAAGAGIRMGNRIHREQALLHIQRQATTDVGALDTAYNLLQQQQPDDQARFDALVHNGVGNPSRQNIFENNSYACWYGGVQHDGIFVILSRINHACQPNARTVFNDTTRELELYALAHIDPGEEITVSYSALTEASGWPTRGVRHHELTQYNFPCTCSLCTAESTTPNATSTRRTTLAGLLARLQRDHISSRPREVEDALSYRDLVQEELGGVVAGRIFPEVVDPRLVRAHALLRRAYLRAGQKDNAATALESAVSIAYMLGKDATKQDTKSAFGKKSTLGCNRFRGCRKDHRWQEIIIASMSVNSLCPRISIGQIWHAVVHDAELSSREVKREKICSNNPTARLSVGSQGAE